MAAAAEGRVSTTNGLATPLNSSFTITIPGPSKPGKLEGVPAGINEGESSSAMIRVNGESDLSPEDE